MKPAVHWMPKRKSEFKQICLKLVVHTTIAVAHRLSTIRNADEILLVDGRR